MNIVTE